MDEKSSKMKILLIDPPFQRFIGFKAENFPLGIGYLGAVLSKQGHEVKIYDAEFSPKTRYIKYSSFASRYDNYLKALESSDHPIFREIALTVEEYEPDIVGISVISVKFACALKIASLCKRISKDIKIIMGGQHPTIHADEALKNPYVDFVVRGEGEDTIVELVQNIGNPQEYYSRIAGISYKSNGKIIHNRMRSFIKDLDSIPIPDRRLVLNISSYPPEQLGKIMMSRGCPFRCGYCGTRNMWKRRVRYRSVDNVIQELKYLKRNFHTKNIEFYDDNFTLDRKRIFEFCHKLSEERIRITWSCFTRADLIDEEIIEAMKKAGCTRIDIGIESGSPRILELIKKDISLSQIRKAAKILHKSRIFWYGFFLIGLPTETKEDIDKTKELLKELDPPWAGCSIFTPYPGTELYDICNEMGLIPQNIDWSNFSHQSLYSNFSGTMSSSEFKEVAEETLRFFESHNGRMRSLIARAKSRRYNRNPRLLLKDIKKMFNWKGILSNHFS